MGITEEYIKSLVGFYVSNPRNTARIYGIGDWHISTSPFASMPGWAKNTAIRLNGMGLDDVRIAYILEEMRLSRCE